jgi:diguanylate cyclase (GGDEF)-like protein
VGTSPPENRVELHDGNSDELRRLARLLDLPVADLVGVGPELVGRLLRHLRLARQDSLTGVANRRAIDERLAQEWERATRHDRPLSIVMLDVDDLKVVNDTEGHAAGDQLLRDVALALMACVRGSDTVGRSGADEFVLICPETDQVAVTVILHKVSRTVSASVSVGAATLARGQSLADLVLAADGALHRSKAGNSNGHRPMPNPGRTVDRPAKEDTTGEDLRAALRAKSDFMSLAAHELRAPITVVRGYLSLVGSELFSHLRMEGPDPVALMESKLEAMERLTQQLLEVARLEDGNLPFDNRPIDLRDVVRAALDSAAAAAEPAHRLEVVLPDDEVTVHGDEARLVTIVANLVANAMKYSPDGGPVECRAEVHEDHARVLVTDEGIGISEADRRRLFQPFVRLERGGDGNVNGHGHGLGLYLSRELARRHGGDLTVLDTRERGTTFALELPLAGDRAT